MTNEGSTPPPAVSILGLGKSYAGRRVVDSVTFEAHSGQVTAVLGPNGAGKTTTIECCEGLRRPDEGVVRVLGRDPLHTAPGERGLVGTMLQDGGLPAGARAGEFLRHIARLHSRPRDVDDLVERLALGPHLRTTVRRLSGGLRQRLLLAIALVGRPQVLFLDEPSTGLDPQARLAVWEVIREERAAGVAVVLTTHLMEEAESLADRIVIIDQGRVIANGSLENLLRVPAREAGVRLDIASLTERDAPRLGEALRVRGLESHQVVAVPGQSGVQRELASLFLPGARLEPDLLRAVADWIDAVGVLPLRLDAGKTEPVGAGLEDLFLRLTGRALS